MNLLDVSDLSVEFSTSDGIIKAVSHLNPVSYTHLTLPTKA